MDRNQAAEYARKQLSNNGLDDWSVRLSTSERGYMGLCSYQDKCIILNAHHIDINPEFGVYDTILHEVAHALVGPNHGHDEEWKAKAKELGCRPEQCSEFSLDPDLIDAIRSGATIEYTVEEETIIKRTPKVRITRLQDKCPECGKVAIEKFRVKTVDKDGNECVLITLSCFHITKKIIPKATPYESLVSNDWKDEIKNCAHIWNKNQCTKCNEFKLFNFQIVGARFIEQGLAIQKGTGIFDDMGLGKTVQALAYIKYHKESTPTLYIVKSAIKFNWLKEILRWLGPSYLGQIINTSKDSIIPNLKTYIIAYDLLRRMPAEKIESIGIKTIVMDECQQIKNVDSGRTQAVRKIVNKPEIKVIPLSGTPWKNRGSEFFPVLNILSPTKFWSQAHFLNNWVEYYYEGSKRKEGGINRPEKFKEYIHDIILRREYNEVMDEYPDINRMKIRVQLDDLTQREYDSATSSFIAWYNEAVISGTDESLSGIEILAKLAKMRHITGLAKIPATISFAEEFYENTDKSLVIFVHHQDVGAILFDEFKKLFPDVNVCKLTGAMNDVEKFESANEFNLKRSFMIASTLAAGEGINLQSCHDSIMHERQWNPQNEDQAAPGRFRRIGQKSNVINISFCEAEETVDEFLDHLVEKKRKAFHDTMNKSVLHTWNDNDMGKELAKMIMGKHKAKAKPIDRPSLTAMARM